jgi:hypothetical protein
MLAFFKLEKLDKNKTNNWLTLTIRLIREIRG